MFAQQQLHRTNRMSSCLQDQSMSTTTPRYVLSPPHAALECMLVNFAHPADYLILTLAKFAIAVYHGVLAQRTVAGHPRYINSPHASSWWCGPVLTERCVYEFRDAYISTSSAQRGVSSTCDVSCCAWMILSTLRSDVTVVWASMRSIVALLALPPKACPTQQFMNLLRISAV